MCMNGANSMLSIEVAASRSHEWDDALCTRNRDGSPARRTLDFCSVRPGAISYAGRRQTINVSTPVYP
jgi:hypothetical protein